MPYDVNHAREHPDVAGWALGALDPDDARAFEQHLESCDQCPAAVAEFKAIAETFSQAAPRIEPPPDLTAKSVAAVQFAMMEAARPDLAPVPAVPKASRWWHVHLGSRCLPLLTAAAAAAVTAAAFIGSSLFSAAPAVAATFTMTHVPGETGSATAVARATTGGYQIELDANNLPKLRPGQFYECVYVDSSGRDLVSGGTFSASNGTITMQSAANPEDFTIIQIRREGPGVGVQDAPVVLSSVTHAH
jgi:hypothetical protein